MLENIKHQIYEDLAKYQNPKTVKLVFKNNVELSLKIDFLQRKAVSLKENNNFWFQFDQTEKLNIPDIVFRKYLIKPFYCEEILKSQKDNLKLLFLLKKFKLNPKNEIKFNLDIVQEDEIEIFWSYLVFRTREEDEKLSIFRKQLSSGYVYAPYVPLITTGIIRK